MSDQRAVLITGCSSGIGRAAAVFLAQQGFVVLATVRKETDADNLRKLNFPNLISLCPLDLTKLDQISSMASRIGRELGARKIKGLYGVINNAGGGFIAPIELMDPEKFRIELETRILGPVALLQALLPMIREANGRILWIATPALMPIPFVSSIHACDFAVNCISRTLHLELAKWKIPCVQIRCGGVMTAAPGKNDRELQDSLGQWPPERLKQYQDALQKEQREFASFDKKRCRPEEIAKVIYRALCARIPRRRYQAGHMAGLSNFLEYLPQPLVDYIMMKRG